MKLVWGDGCRDPAYTALAPASPWSQDTNTLVNNFDFRVFMFEDMQSGDSIVITAKVELIMNFSLNLDWIRIRLGLINLIYK